MVCNGVCVKYKFKKSNITRQVYSDGASRCQTCEIFIRWDGAFCPCCGVKVRKVPRNKHGKEAMRVRNKTRVDRKKGEYEESFIKVVG